MFPSGGSTSRGGLLPTAPTPPLHSLSLKRRRSGSGAEEQSPPEAQLPAETKKPRREQKQPIFQLLFLPPTMQDPPASYKTYQPTPPIDSDSDSSSDRFATRFADSVPMLEDDDNDDDVMMDVSEQRVPRVVVGPPTPVTEVMGRLDVSGDVDMERPEEEVGGVEVGVVVKKKSGVFRMGFRGDCEKCRLRVPGHYSHY